MGEIDDAAAHRLLQAISAAAGHELAVDLDFDEGELALSRQREPFCTEIIDGDGDLVVAKLARDILREREIANDIGPVAFDDQPLEGRMIRQFPMQKP